MLFLDIKRVKYTENFDLLTVYFFIDCAICCMHITERHTLKHCLSTAST